MLGTVRSPRTTGPTLPTLLLPAISHRSFGNPPVRSVAVSKAVTTHGVATSSALTNQPATSWVSLKKTSSL